MISKKLVISLIMVTLLFSVLNGINRNWKYFEFSIGDEDIMSARTFSTSVDGYTDNSVFLIMKMVDNGELGMLYLTPINHNFEINTLFFFKDGNVDDVYSVPVNKFNEFILINAVHMDGLINYLDGGLYVYIVIMPPNSRNKNDMFASKFVISGIDCAFEFIKEK